VFPPIFHESAGTQDLLHLRGEGVDGIRFPAGFNPSFREIEPNFLSIVALQVRFYEREPDIDRIPEKDPGK
jgi:hypothetical protein